jgi:hypothetical protein
MNHLALLLAATASQAFAADLTGSWKAIFKAPPMERPKTVSEMFFDLKADGGKFTGTAKIGSWPGDGPVLDGKIVGDRISFTFIGKSPWKMSGPSGDASGLPRLTFVGTIRGDEIQLTATWDSVMLYGKTTDTRPQEYELLVQRERK